VVETIDQARGGADMDMIIAIAICGVVLGGIGLQAVVSIVEALAKRQPTA
jgi:hypothetical protein